MKKYKQFHTLWNKKSIRYYIIRSNIIFKKKFIPRIQKLGIIFHETLRCPYIKIKKIKKRKIKKQNKKFKNFSQLKNRHDPSHKALI